MTEREQPPHHRAPLGFTQVCADAERAELLMAVVVDLLGLLAAQHVDEMVDAKTLAIGLVKAIDAAERLLRSQAGIPRFGWRQTVVAVAARRTGLTKVFEQVHAATLVRLGQR